MRSNKTVTTSKNAHTNKTDRWNDDEEKNIVILKLMCCFNLFTEMELLKWSCKRRMDGHNCIKAAVAADAHSVSIHYIAQFYLLWRKWWLAWWCSWMMKCTGLRVSVNCTIAFCHLKQMPFNVNCFDTSAMKCCRDSPREREIERDFIAIICCYYCQHDC